ncbi:MAG: methanogenesis marker protein Mmp4/MtxX [Promethearchaeota archaeon]
MSYFREILSLIRDPSRKLRIGVGVGGGLESPVTNIAPRLEDFLEENLPNAEIFLYSPRTFDLPGGTSSGTGTEQVRVRPVNGVDSTLAIVGDLASGKIDGAVRGTLPSSGFLKAVRETFQVPRVSRLALMETKNHYAFLFGPVGIDEDTKQHKTDFVRHGLVLLEALGMPLTVRLLSGGRLGDLARSERIRRSIEETTKLASELSRQFPGASVEHGEILIEKAFRDGARLVVAPDGVSGNLIYRTLVHLGGGRAFGAPYLGLPALCIDTSRLGNFYEVLGSILLIYLLSGLSGKK